MRSQSDSNHPCPHSSATLCEEDALPGKQGIFEPHPGQIFGEVGPPQPLYHSWRVSVRENVVASLRASMLVPEVESLELVAGLFQFVIVGLK